MEIEVKQNEKFQINGRTFKAIKAPYGLCNKGDIHCIGKTEKDLCKAFPTCILRDMETSLIFIEMNTDYANKSEKKE